MPWIEPFVSWLASHIPTKDDFNRIEGNILHLNDNKVEKVDGKGLSTNDYTTAEKNKLANIESGATADMSANEILAAIKTVDGVESGLDADTLDGYDSSAFAAVSHSHSGYAPTSHASLAITYGLGTTVNYGHVKTINGLAQSTHADGTALSAYQGYVLNQVVTNKNVTSKGSVQYTDTIAGNSVLIKNIAIGSDKTQGRLSSKKISIGANYGAIIFFSKAIQSAVSVVRGDTYTNVIDKKYASDSYLSGTSNFAAWAVGNSYIYIQDVYISDGNLVIEFYNSNANSQTLGCLINWEVWS